jgi:hypothetical protein
MTRHLEQEMPHVRVAPGFWQRASMFFDSRAAASAFRDAAEAAGLPVADVRRAALEGIIAACAGLPVMPWRPMPSRLARAACLLTGCFGMALGRSPQPGAAYNSAPVQASGIDVARLVWRPLGPVAEVVGVLAVAHA